MFPWCKDKPANKNYGLKNEIDLLETDCSKAFHFVSQLLKKKKNYFLAI
jgi:hypothetical protein